MIHIPVVQGSEDWLRARMGRPTASEFDRIITAKKWEPTSGAARRSYQVRLLTELILDCPLDDAVTPAMIHGTDFEAKTKAAYEMLHGVDIEPCGFCTNDDGTVGASPDGFVGSEGMVECKSPFKPEIHCGYLLNPQTLADQYWIQAQAQLYICDGRKWTDLISYFGGMPMVTIRVTPHAEFQQKLDVALRSFVCELSDLVERAKAEGWIKPKAEAPDHTRDWLTQDDIDKLLAAKQGEYGIQETSIG